jgi:hypothetical protein
MFSFKTNHNVIEKIPYFFDKKKVKLFFTVFFRVLKTAVLSRVRGGVAKISANSEEYFLPLSKRWGRSLFFCRNPLFPLNSDLL